METGASCNGRLSVYTYVRHPLYPSFVSILPMIRSTTTTPKVRLQRSRKSCVATRVYACACVGTRGRVALPLSALHSHKHVRLV